MCIRLVLKDHLILLRTWDLLKILVKNLHNLILWHHLVLDSNTWLETSLDIDMLRNLQNFWLNFMILNKFSFKQAGTTLLSWVLNLCYLESIHQERTTMFLMMIKKPTPFHLSKTLILLPGSMKWAMKLFHIKQPSSQFKWMDGLMIIY